MEQKNREANVMPHDFIIGPTDTDSISFAKKDGSPFSKEELDLLLSEINSISPELITWEDDGYYKKCIVLKAKNYILYDPTKDKESERKQVKGSAFKSAKKEPALASLMQDMVDAILNDRESTLVDIYESYVHEAMNIKDIRQWSSKISVTEAVLKCKGYEAYSKDQLKAKGIRANETNVWDAIKNEDLIQQGDKFYVFPAILSAEEISNSKTLKSGKVKTTTKIEYKYGLLQPQYWDGKNHDVRHLLLRLYETVSIFDSILDISMFKNYALVKNFKLLLDKQSAIRYTVSSGENT